jgi:pimeloyl-ACP methyl ester carboxylesterase
METRPVDVGGIELSIAEAGAGGRPLFLLHGFTGAKEDFTDWLDALASEGWWVVAPDHRGHGASAKPAEESAYSLEILAADVLALADVLGWDTYVALGHSMGGMLLQVAALRAPERLDAIIMMDTSSEPLSAIDEKAVAAAQGIVRERGIDALADILATREGLLTTPAHERLLAERPGYKEFGERKMRATSPALYAAIAGEIPTRTSLLEDLRKIDVPALVIVGDQDMPFIAPSERMAETFPQGRLAVIPDAGHSPQFENTDAWWAALTGFLSSLPAAAA